MTVNLTPPAEREFPGAHLQQRRQHLVSRIQAEQRRQLSRPLHLRHWPVVAVAVLAAVVAGATTFVLTRSGGPSRAQILSILGYVQPPPVSRNEHGGRSLASAALLDAAHIAAKRPAQEAGLGPGQFMYTKEKALWENVDEGDPVRISFRPVTREDWKRPDGSGRYVETDGHLLFPTAADAAYFYNAYRNQQDLLNGHTSDETYPAGPPNYDQLSKAPTDPAKLKQLIESRRLGYGPPGDAETFQIVGDLLRETGAPPAVRSALYTIASELPGVELIGPTHDPLGRPGTGVAYVSRGENYEIIFDPQTSAMLAERTTVAQTSKEDPFPPGSVIGWTAYVASGIVDSDSATTSATP
jgi:hypothetical protein